MADYSKISLLDGIQSPGDLKKLSQDDLVTLCGEIRQFLIESVSTNPGHFASSLGVIELTVALHYVFNTPYDKIIWDVGHQAYPHKILTGRREQFHSNRRYKGISGFPKMSESPYDAFGTGHSSTSVSAALGMAMASQLRKEEDRQHIAVIGDGSLTAGMAFEALNHAGVSNTNILVILNDNGIAIDNSVGALKEYLTDITTSWTYNRLKDEIWNTLGALSKYGPDARGVIQKVETAIKTAVFRQSNLFESLNFRYFGPIDGHDVNHLTRILSDLKNIKGPKLLHVNTVKGKGYSFAEKEQTRFHAPGFFDKLTGQSVVSPEEKNKPPKYQTVFGKTILELARQNPKIVGITPAMPTGCSLNILMKEIPERGFDVGIAEQHAVTFSAGLAAQGLIPYCNIYSSFLQRAYDQMIHDVALQNLPVIFCLDRAGLVGEDGATHHGAFDLSFLRCIPNIILSAPMDEVELRNLMYTAQLKPKGPFVIRYPRGNGVLTDWQRPFAKVPIGKGRQLKEGHHAAIISIGHVGNIALQTAQELGKTTGLSLAHFDLRFLKPLDEDLLHHVFRNFSNVITIEDNALAGGMGSAVIEFMADNGYQASVKRLGIPDYFVEQGTLEELYAECGFDAAGLKKTILEECENFLPTKDIKHH
ncbi:MAG: 1-deoxy-D-xylulose-5-phosphate synthase [Bacteroides sp.]|jgi:1-deoxy-D-xylulose-5-phosphate synthase|nr:1-deoxy-D-xylulose-5-phosphate synthase [Bacteroides sp.]